MKIALVLIGLFGSAAFGQSLILTSTDARCTGTPLTCTFVAQQNAPNDYGLPIVAATSGGGTWTIGAENQSTCDATLFTWTTQGTPPGAPPSISSFNTTTMLYLAPNAGVAGRCAAGTYTHTITFTNSISGIYTLTVVQRVVYRLAAPVFLNGCGVSETSLSGGAQGNCPGGQTQATPAANTFTYDLNKVPCPNCRPGGTFNLPAPGSSWIDEFGNTHTVVSPVGCVSSGDVEKANQSLNSNWIIGYCFLNGTYSGWYIFPATGTATPDTAGYPIAQSDLGNSTYSWSNTDDTTIYGIDVSAPDSGGDSFFRKVVLDTPPNYHNVTGPGYTAGSKILYRLDYATYGRIDLQAFSHQDQNSSGWFAVHTTKDYSANVTTSGTAVTWSSGPTFDTNKLLDQSLTISGSAYIVTAVADSTHLTIATSAGVHSSPVVASARIPWKLLALNWNLMESLGSSFTPVSGDLTALTRPHVNYNSTSSYVSHGTVAGKLYIAHLTQPHAVWASFTPGVDSTLALTNSFNQIQAAGYQGGSQCKDADSVASSNASYCYQGPHGSSFADSAGNQWIVMVPGGASFDTIRMDAQSSTLIPYPANGFTGNFTIPLWTQYSGGEYGGARKAPYMLASTNSATFFHAPPTAWNVTTCSNTNPMVVTVSANSDTGINTTTHNKVLIGGVQGNTACNGSWTVTAVSSTSGSLDNIWTLSSNGNGAYVPSTGAATEDVPFAGFADGDADQAFLCRDLCREVRRLGHLRSVPYSDSGQESYFAVPRATLSMDASTMVYTTNNGIPNSPVIVIATTGVSGIGMTSNMFDQTHAVTSVSVTATTGTLIYSTPDTGSVIVDVCTSQRWPDVPGGTSPDGSCRTLTNSSGTNPRTSTFSGLITGALYYYRIVANNKSMAWGSFTPAVSANGGTILNNAVAANAVIQ